MEEILNIEGIVKRLEDTKLDFVSNREGLEDKTCDGTLLGIKTSEGIINVKFPKRFSKSGKEIILNRSVQYFKEYKTSDKEKMDEIQKWGYKIKFLQGTYQDKEIEAEIII